MMDKRFNRVQIDYWTRINGRTRAHTHTRTPHYVYYKRRVCARTKVTRVKNGRQLSIFDVYITSFVISCTQQQPGVSLATCAHACTDMYMYVYIYICIYICVHIRVISFVPVLFRVCIYIYIYICICICIYIHIYIHIHYIL